MIWNDLINGSLEFIGGVLTFVNVASIRRDKKVQGVHWSTYAFFTGWGLWNLLYYPSLNQWFSFSGGCLIVLGNTVWLSHALYYMRQNDTIS